MYLFSHLLEGQSLDEAQAALENRIRADPANADHRAALVQLLCLQGQWARARSQMKSWLALKPQAKPTVTLIEQCVEAEMARAAVFSGEAQPRMPDEGSAWMHALLRALTAEQQGDSALATSLRAEALDAALPTAAHIFSQHSPHPQAVEWITDGDGRLGPVCEMAVNGHYYWIPFSLIEEIQFQEPASVTDLVWRHALVKLLDGSEQVCQIPARYPFEATAEDNIKLAKITHWQSLDASTYLGSGQKTWLDSDGQFPLLALTRVVFAATESVDE